MSGAPSGRAPARAADLLGAVVDADGTTFSVWSPRAASVTLGLFDGGGRAGERRVPMRLDADGHWRVRVPGAGPGTRYGYRVDGPWAPEQGERFNAAKLLLDPRAGAIAGPLRHAPPIFGYRVEDATDLARDDRDSAPFVPRSVVVDPAFDWGDDRRPGTPWDETVIYELHVRGFTRRHPDVPEAWRGTYAGLGCAPVVDYLRGLGVTALELLPVHHSVTEVRVARRGLTNYWGYSPVGLFAPDARLAAGGDAGAQVAEFKAMVKALHAAGLEVILDVVYNHTAEEDHLGPTLGFRGLDNRAYYLLRPDAPRLYQDFTGCGHTVNAMHPAVRRLILDSLRYWAVEMRVDGFRLDLAAALARGGGPGALGALFGEMAADPALAGLKLIVEPWDAGPDGFRLGAFPPPWAEWNPHYRDTVRRFWRGDAGQAAELATRLAGSSDVFAPSGRRPWASVNYVTCHDGFTLADLVSYAVKHNEANGEGNADGPAESYSWNRGVEGPTDDPGVRAARARDVRSLLATLLLSQGTPMLLAGDERGRTQRGNNNAYCQDNEVSWVDWRLDAGREALLAFTRRLVALRRAHPVFRRRTFFDGALACQAGFRDLAWFREDGAELTEADWRDPERRVLGMRLCGADARREEPRDDTFLALLNGSDRPVEMRLPGAEPERAWRLVLDTSALDGEGGSELAPGRAARVPAGTLLLFRAVA